MGVVLFLCALCAALIIGFIIGYLTALPNGGPE